MRVNWQKSFYSRFASCASNELLELEASSHAVSDVAFSAVASYERRRFPSPRDLGHAFEGQYARS